jgi:hypothetical protein
MPKVVEQRRLMLDQEEMKALDELAEIVADQIRRLHIQVRGKEASR